MIAVEYTIDRSRERMELTQDWDGESYTVEICGVEQPAGGQRWYFRCPDCESPCGRLYCPPGIGFFVCRICADLTYRSCQESDRHRTLFASLGASRGVSREVIADAFRSWSKGRRSAPLYPSATLE